MRRSCSREHVRCRCSAEHCQVLYACSREQDQREWAKHVLENTFDIIVLQNLVNCCARVPTNKLVENSDYRVFWRTHSMLMFYRTSSSIHVFYRTSLRMSCTACSGERDLFLIFLFQRTDPRRTHPKRVLENTVHMDS